MKSNEDHHIKLIANFCTSITYSKYLLSRDIALHKNDNFLFYMN